MKEKLYLFKDGNGKGVIAILAKSWKEATKMFDQDFKTAPVTRDSWQPHIALKQVAPGRWEN